MSFADINPVVPINACETVSGQYVDIVSPQVNTIVLTDIAWAMSRQARFAGHTLSQEIWNVAQHSCFVLSLIEKALHKDNSGSQLWASLVQFVNVNGEKHIHDIHGVHTRISNKDNLLLHALMHDSPEAYLIDLPSPVKRHPALRGPYKELENGIKNAIDSAFLLEQLTAFEERIIHWGDLLALRIEAAALMPSRGRGWSGDLPKMEITDLALFPQVLGWKDSYDLFLKEYIRIGGIRVRQ